MVAVGWLARGNLRDRCCVCEDWIHDMDYFYAIVFVEAKPKFITWTVTANSENGWKINAILFQRNAIKTQRHSLNFNFNRQSNILFSLQKSQVINTCPTFQVYGVQVNIHMCCIYLNPTYGGFILPSRYEILTLIKRTWVGWKGHGKSHRWHCKHTCHLLSVKYLLLMHSKNYLYCSGRRIWNTILSWIWYG